MPVTLRVLELYCGIGGCAAALPPGAEVVAALDIDRTALEVYRANHPHPAEVCTLESLRADDVRLDADLWWLSPPCQPFTRRGLGRDLDDPRCASLLHLLGLIARVRPPLLALENVPPFLTSRARARVLATLEGAGYETRERLLCPSELGIPNRRRRYYLVASRRGLAAPEPRSPPPPLRPLASFLDDADPAELTVSGELLARYAHAVDVVHAGDPAAVAATFTAAYGRSPVRAGSYLRRGAVVRRFHPREVARLLGLPPGFRLPGDPSHATAWRLLGSSLSVPAVRTVLAALPELAPALARPAAATAPPLTAR
jgi:site-specific DNA-cytosine methylase